MSMEVRLRSVNLRDLEQIYKIEVESFKYPYPFEYLKVLLFLAGEFFIVAEENNKVIGYAVGVLEKNNVGHIVSIAVSRDYRGRGIGRKLLEELERRLKNKGAKDFKLEVRISNRIAISLYTKLGYKIKEVVKNYYPDGEDAYVMVKHDC